MSTIEAGADFRTLGDRINTLEHVKRRELERADREKQSLSTEVDPETYSDFPFNVNRLNPTGDLRGLKDLLGCSIAATDVQRKEDDDPRSGHMKVMLFEEEIPGWQAIAH